MQLGVKSVIIEHPDSWAKSLVDEGVIAKFVPIDMSQDAEAVFEQSLAAIRALGNDPLTLDADAVITFCELSVPVVARLAEVLGLPGPRPLSVDKARDKHRTRAEMKAAGLPTPKNMLIKGADELSEAMKTVGFPAVLKPISGAASLGVKKVSSEQELRKSYVEIISELSKLVVSSGALTQDDGTGKGIKAESAMDCTLLMEQYLDGNEVDVDVVMSQGEWRYAAVTDNGPTLEPYFNETYAVCPSVLPSNRQKELKDLAISTLKCLGFTEGVFHVECKYTSHGPHLIEVNARMGGGQVHETNLRVWGVDLVEETLFVAAGIPCRPFIADKNPPGGGVAYCDINAEESGTLQNLDFLTSLQQKEGVVWARPYIRAGTEVVGPKDGLPTWIAEFLVQRPTATAALACLQRHQLEVKPDIR
ncbi:CARNS1 [Symbiodinium natans]|uniref:CARNS1 protein n=1 Tax=Symbiodinium natans TaxID=878477 RepID=A0A812KH26_9DINO|nr:CARNS1 [Symbiodinium natans]